MTTINFCGDSFCGGMPRPDVSWTTILADKLNANIIGLGRPGAAYEQCFIDFNPSADYTVFCWTQPDRLYHKLYEITEWQSCDKRAVHRVYAAACAYYQLIHDKDLAIRRFQRECYWFDHAILCSYAGQIIHLDCFANLYTWNVGIKHTIPILNDQRTNPVLESSDEIANHFNVKQNAMLADELFELFCKELS
jgi:hypothetical protein